MDALHCKISNNFTSYFFLITLSLTSCNNGYNTYNNDSKKIPITLKTDLITKSEECVLFCGNPGVGKSSLCNSIFQKPVFSSGVSAGTGITTLQQSHDYNGSTYIDTPGLEDITFREQAAKQIEKALKKDGNYKIIFVAMLDAGRIRPADLVTINTVCEAIKAPFEYGVIFNKVTTKASKVIDETGGIEQHLKQLTQEPSQCIFIAHNNDMYDESDTFLGEELREESSEREKLMNFIYNLKAYPIKKEDILSLDIEKFEEKAQEISEKYNKMLKILRREKDNLQKQKENLKKNADSQIGLFYEGNTQVVMPQRKEKNILKLEESMQESYFRASSNEKGEERSLCNGSDVGINEYGTKPIHIAAREGNEEKMKALLREPNNINTKDNRGFTPLHYAAKENNKEAVNFLISRGPKISKSNLFVPKISCCGSRYYGISWSESCKKPSALCTDPKLKLAIIVYEEDNSCCKRWCCSSCFCSCCAGC